jgi:hypothetical protein
MAGTGAEDNDIACVELEDTALLSSEADVPARDPHRLMRRSPDFPFLGNKQPQLLVFA